MSKISNEIIARAARDVLGPLGFQRKRRSRTWLADRGWWVAAVAFQPSTLTPGSGLNVAAHFLWSEIDLSFDFGLESPGNWAFEEDAGFADAVHDLAKLAAAHATRLFALLPNIETGAKTLADEVRRLPRLAGASWPAYNAAMAAVLAGKVDRARKLLSIISDDRVSPSAQELAAKIDNPDEARAWIKKRMIDHRAVLGLELRD